ncbi:hypothetical protein LN042_11345 [Kitasatospora sp. RB6PN24]|uniref:hypothetical protein n=1 Tax=Kitasatospora humi TaxID=2893891 RepID=UPI001E3D7811|nr:hypothetical protein [Kitasatospora humi]MCC9307690.1 hypothetical protein [Kitasatospora humi]
MYERPQRRAAVTRQDVERAEFRADLVEMIDSDSEVRAAILRLLTTARAARKPRPAVIPPVRQTRGGGR